MSDKLERDVGGDDWGPAAADYVSLHDSAVDWAPLSSEALHELLTDRTDTIVYILRLEMAVDVLRSQQDADTRFFNAVSNLAPDVCDRALDSRAEVPR